MIHLNQISKLAEINGTKPAFISDLTILSWEDFKRQTEFKISYLINTYGNNLPSQACFVAKNRVDLLPWLAACATLSIPVTGLDYSLTTETLISMANSINADFFLISSIDIGAKIALPDFCRDTPNKSCFVLDLDSLGITAIDGIASAHPFRAINNTKPFYSVGFTSGTSGNPKAVYRSKSFDKRRFNFFSNRYGFNTEDKFLLALPLFHAAGNGWARLFLSHGCTIYIPADDNPESISSLLDTHEITTTVLSPPQLARLLSHREPNAIAKPLKLRWALIGGKNFTAIEKLKSINYFGPIIYEYYGTTETGVNTIAEPSDLLIFPNSVGRAYDGNEILIVTDAGDLARAGAVGTVCIYSYMNMDNYLGKSNDDTSAFIIRNGYKYFITPDQGFLDKDGRLFLLSRSGSSGEKINIYELEDRLRRLPEINDVALLLENGLIYCFYTPNQNCGDMNLLGIILDVAISLQLNIACCVSTTKIPYAPSGKARAGELKKLMPN